ncbi:hypothetical protein BH23CHL8_BH23CHL8_21130 [soil metagenome]
MTSSELDDDLRTVGDALIEDAERLKEIEQQKAQLGARHPRSQELSTEGTRIVERLRVGAEVQEGLTREAAQGGDDDSEGSA